MPLVSFPTPVIELPVADRVSGDTRVRQKARFVSLFHQQLGESSDARITVRVSLYAADASAPAGYGAPLSGPGFSAYDAVLSADNRTLVDASNGAILAMQQLGQTAQEWEAVVAGFDQNTMLQGDFFGMLRDTQAVNIGDMIRQHIAQADAMGRFA